MGARAGGNPRLWLTLLNADKEEIEYISLTSEIEIRGYWPVVEGEFTITLEPGVYYIEIITTNWYLWPYEPFSIHIWDYY